MLVTHNSCGSITPDATIQRDISEGSCFKYAHYIFHAYLLLLLQTYMYFQGLVDEKRYIRIKGCIKGMELYSLCHVINHADT